MAVSPSLNAADVITLTIASNGTALADTIQIVSVEVTKAVNKISYARIVIEDGNMPEATFPVSDTATFIPGAAITINAGYGSETALIFSGVVVKHGIKITGNNEGRLVIECRHKAAGMTVGRKSANYVDKKDSDIITAIIGQTSGLTANVTATTTQYKELVQFNCSDWDFMLARAEANGQIVITEDTAKVTVGPPLTSATPALSVTYGIDLMSFTSEIDARTQLAEVTATAWDPATLAIVEQTATPATLNTQGNITSATLAGVLGLASYAMPSMAAIDSATLTSWAKGRMVKAGLSRIRGTMKFQGSELAVPGGLITLAGIGERFNGNVFVGSVRHIIEDGNWLTEVEFGLEPEWLGDRSGGMGLAPGLTPAATGLHVGIVMKLDADPSGLSKIQVKIPVMNATTVGVWARLASFYGSSSVGSYFIPEIGDEVIIGYFDNDPSHPVVLGSLYGSKNKVPYPLTADNYTKAILTKAKLLLEFDDENKVITLVTPSKNTIVISDKDKSITLTDQTGNSVELGTSGIKLDSPKDIVMTATGKITLTATGNVEATSKADVKLAGLNVNADAKVGFVAKGAASAEVSASGQVTIKGAMVMIN
jgi:Rhs element Vgr protein